MHPEQKKRFEKDLVRELDGLGTRFEPFCYELIEFVAPAEWTHRGTTKDGAPVGYTVDSKAYGGRWVAEYGAEKTYFTDDFKKLAGDIAHALRLHPQVDSFWAVSNQEAPPSASTALANVVARAKRCGITVTVLDARDVARFIVEHLFNDLLVEKLSGYLSTLERIQTEYAASHRIPKYSDYVERASIEAEVIKRLDSDHVLLVAGIGGSGKSAVCSAVAQRLEGDFEAVLWIDADSLRRAEDLSSVDVLRNGGMLNVLGLVQTRQCLLVLDNLTVELDLHGLLAGAHTRSRIVATAQVASPGALVLNELEPAEARKVLDPSGTCPPELFSQIISSVGAHPLMLSLLGGLEREEGGSWSDVSEMLQAATGLEDTRGPAGMTRVCERILARHRASLEHAFRLVALLGPRIDEALWDEIAGKATRRAFLKRHFLAASSPDVVRVHDIVAASIRELLRGKDTEGVVRALLEFIESQMGETHSMTMQRIVRYHFASLERLLLAGHTEPALRYAYALSRRTGLNRDLLGQPLALVPTLTSLGAKVSIGVRSIIETIECTYTLVSQEHSKDIAKETLKTMFPAYEQMLAIPGLPGRVERDLKHHRGKALDRLGRFDEAAAVFEDVLKTDPEFPAAELQLARVLARISARSSEALARLEAVFRFAEQRPMDLNLSIVLGAFETLTWTALKERMLETISAHRTLLVDSLKRALKFGHDQPYKLIAALGLKLSYDAPGLFLELVELVPERLSPAETDEELFAWAQTLKLAGKALREAHDERAPSFFKEAVTFYLQLKKPNEFMIIQFAEGMLLVDRAADAEKLLDRVVASQRKEFWYHRKAEALRMKGDFALALTQIDLALAVEKSSYRSTYLYERFRIRVGLGDTAARADLDAAILECKNDKFKRQLDAERDLLDKKPSP